MDNLPDIQYTPSIPPFDASASSALRVNPEPSRRAQRDDRHQTSIEMGNQFPFDASDAWWEQAGEELPTPPPTDWAHTAARAVIADLQDRRGIKRGLERSDYDEDVRFEIIDTLAGIIRLAAAQQDRSGQEGVGE